MKEYNFVNMYYYENIKRVGGVENSIYQLVKKYHKDYDITVVYKECDVYQLRRLQKYVRCVKYNGEKITCKRAFYGYHCSIIENVTAERHTLVVHTDYSAQWDLGIKNIGNLPKNPKLTDYLCVSNVSKEGFEKIMGMVPKRCYNVYVPEPPQKVWHFVTFGRIDDQKGSKQYAKFCDILDSIPNFKYDLTVISDGKIPSTSKNIIYLPPRLDVLDYVNGHYDCGVFFSLHESFGYSPVECLCLGIPVIASDLPAYREIGINSKNGFLVDNDLSNLDIEKIVKKLEKGMVFTYEPPKDEWDKYLVPSKSTYTFDDSNYVLVKCISRYKDLEWNDFKVPGDIYYVSRDRLDRLTHIEVLEDGLSSGIGKKITKESDVPKRRETWVSKLRDNDGNKKSSE